MIIKEFRLTIYNKPDKKLYNDYVLELIDIINDKEDIKIKTECNIEKKVLNYEANIISVKFEWKDSLRLHDMCFDYIMLSLTNNYCINLKKELLYDDAEQIQKLIHFVLKQNIHLIKYFIEN
jgi:hypothetical protein